MGGRGVSYSIQVKLGHFSTCRGRYYNDTWAIGVNQEGVRERLTKDHARGCTI